MAANSIVGEAFVQVGLDTSQLEGEAAKVASKVQGELEAGLDDVEVGVTADTTQFQARFEDVKDRIAGGVGRELALELCLPDECCEKRLCPAPNVG
jgi:hypothetical protein